MTIALVGGPIFHQRRIVARSSDEPEQVWGDVVPYLRGADAVFANLETPITTAPRRWHKGWKAFRLRADPAAVDLLKAANARFVNLANNHILDCDSEGLSDTIGHLDRAAIAHAGAGIDAVEAVRPGIFDVAGRRIGVLSITDNMCEFAVRCQLRIDHGEQSCGQCQCQPWMRQS